MVSCICNGEWVNGLPPEPTPGCKVHTAVAKDAIQKPKDDLVKTLERIAKALEIIAFDKTGKR
jgi:hypothetical protein